ncbi:MAG: enoyl-CoA hydratase/isomerase family protein [Candidatus Heimdallarchaeota archaeon]|nr:MAG: enoyl-CoA hydratase/isomerase family protein [Candidatus Heimdallarchaeota archaeon]
MADELIQVEKKNDIGTILFNNGDWNILNIAMMKQINEALESFLTDQSLKAVVIGHSGRSFSAGVDVGEHMGDIAPKMLREFHDMFKKLNRFNCPTIASVKGAALGGGCEVAVFCDIVIASEKAKFGQPEIKVGVFPPVSALIFPYLTGHKKAYELLLQGETINASEAHRIGLVNHVFPVDSYEQEFDQFLERFKKLSTVVLQHTKKAIRLGFADDFDSQIDKMEDYYLNELMKTHDANEGLKAFVEKRAPEWKNH